MQIDYLICLASHPYLHGLGLELFSLEDMLAVVQ